MRKLNIGCGTDIKKGYINLDKFLIKGVNIVCDIEKFCLPFKNEVFNEIDCFDVLEHVDYITVMRDLYRILKKEGVLKIRVPHFTSAGNFIDPTHKHSFSIRTFDFFIKENGYRNYYFDFHFSKIRHRFVSLRKGKLYFYNYLIECIININNTMRDFYENSFLRLFPAWNIYVEIQK